MNIDNLFFLNEDLAINIESATNNNNNFRKVLYTGKFQLVLMNLKPNESIGLETHKDTDQFFRVESGNGLCIINDKTYNIYDNVSIIVPAGHKHNIINNSNLELKLYTIYSKPEHDPNHITILKN